MLDQSRRISSAIRAAARNGSGLYLSIGMKIHPLCIQICSRNTIDRRANEPKDMPRLRIYKKGRVQFIHVKVAKPGSPLSTKVPISTHIRERELNGSIRNTWPVSVPPHQNGQGPETCPADGATRDLSCRSVVRALETLTAVGVARFHGQHLLMSDRLPKPRLPLCPFIATPSMEAKLSRNATSDLSNWPSPGVSTLEDVVTPLLAADNHVV
ncbi:hypothetical protein Rleg_5854 (plasmid) [Rhizobium leguminosarum bv. trifolii WSM1325]|uniref:Uncharacterized protein n=1 Tax=Rhizobium leguminosarum bv. trifolii (strain WSM1325) TaxID=395491 RepID=C6B8A0_RHILS|nr:hypothetical protein Rleg_5854 [Rhizobium leguminosarum bv. trifolii WSM1325]